MSNFVWIPYFYALIWASVLYFYWKRCGRVLNGGALVLLIWTISSFAGAWYENNLIFEHIHSVTIIPYLYLFFFSMLLCLPILRCRTERVDNICANEKIIDLCIYTAACVNFVPFIENVIHFSLGAEQGAVFDLEAFNAKYDERQSDIYYMTDIGQKFEQVADVIRLLVLVLFFHYFKRSCNLRNKKLTFCLVICVTNIVLMGINTGSRNTLFTYILTSVFIYLVFSKFYSEKIRKTIQKLSLLFAISIIFLFAIISIVRFEEVSSHNAEAKNIGQWLAAYAGESHGIFNADTWYLKDNDLKNNDFIKNFYLYKTFGIIDKPKERTPYPSTYQVKNVQFSTIIGTYYTNYGRTFTTVASIIVCLLFCSILKVKKQMFVSDILLLTYYAKIPLMGFSIFCYMFDGWQLLLTPIMVFLLKLNKT